MAGTGTVPVSGEKMIIARTRVRAIGMTGIMMIETAMTAADARTIVTETEMTATAMIDPIDAGPATKTTMTTTEAVNAAGSMTIANDLDLGLLMIGSKLNRLGRKNHLDLQGISPSP
jgi:hypothetical protein